MSFSIKYQEFIKVKILHRFFLNKGIIDFDSMDSETQLKQLENYSFQSFFEVVPDSKTRQMMNGHRLVFRTEGSDFSIWSQVTSDNPQKPFIELDDNLDLTFLIRLKDFRFLNYTNLLLENEGKIYYFSNVIPLGGPVTFPLIPKPGGSFVDESFILPDENAASELNHFTVNEKKNLWGIIKVWMKSGDNAFHLTDNQGNIPAEPQIFELNFENRSTLWRYIFSSNQTVDASDDIKIENGDAGILVSKSPHPLTNKGFVRVEHGGEDLPNPGISLIKPDNSNNKIYSEIYM